MLQRLQKAHSHYNRSGWEKDYKESKYRTRMLSKNGKRFTDHPYFMQAPHSMYDYSETASNYGPKGKRRGVTQNGSLNSIDRPKSKRRKLRPMTAGNKWRNIRKSSRRSRRPMSSNQNGSRRNLPPMPPAVEEDPFPMSEQKEGPMGALSED